MDAVKFIKERNRMCKVYYDVKRGYCNDCPLRYVECMNIDNAKEDAEQLVKLVEEWSAAHPRKTRQDVFLEQWPEARADETAGVLTICPAELTKECRDDKNACGAYSIEMCVCEHCRREFWSQEVERYPNEA